MPHRKSNVVLIERKPGGGGNGTPRDNFSNEHYSPSHSFAGLSSHIEAQVNFFKVLMKRDKDPEQPGSKKPKTDEANVDLLFETIQFGAGRNQMLDDCRIDGVVQHHQIAPLSRQKDSLLGVAHRERTAFMILSGTVVRPMRILAIDVGGTHIKVLATGRKRPVKIPSGPTMTARKMVAEVLKATAGWNYSAVSIGYPGPVVDGRPMSEPPNLGRGWVKFDYRKAFKRPVRIINDAAMQALGSYKGGRMLFLGLGTGLGSALMLNGHLAPMELAHLPYRNATFEDYAGKRGLDRLGKKRWRHHVDVVVKELKTALVADYVVLGGGNAKLIKKPPPGARMGDNNNAFRGGFRLWNKSPGSK
jgi:polyphosphate glucokinase